MNSFFFCSPFQKLHPSYIYPNTAHELYISFSYLLKVLKKITIFCEGSETVHTGARMVQQETKHILLYNTKIKKRLFKVQTFVQVSVSLSAPSRTARQPASRSSGHGTRTSNKTYTRSKQVITYQRFFPSSSGTNCASSTVRCKLS